jgi:hypothetical protein
LQERAAVLMSAQLATAVSKPTGKQPLLDKTVNGNCLQDNTAATTMPLLGKARSLISPQLTVLQWHLALNGDCLQESICAYAGNSKSGSYAC